MVHAAKLGYRLVTAMQSPSKTLTPAYSASGLSHANGNRREQQQAIPSAIREESAIPRAGRIEPPARCHDPRGGTPGSLLFGCGWPPPGELGAQLGGVRHSTRRLLWNGLRTQRNGDGGCSGQCLVHEPAARRPPAQAVRRCCGSHRRCAKQPAFPDQHDTNATVTAVNLAQHHGDRWHVTWAGSGAGIARHGYGDRRRARPPPTSSPGRFHILAVGRWKMRTRKRWRWPLLLRPQTSAAAHLHQRSHQPASSTISP